MGKRITRATITRELPCKLTPEEYLERLAEMAEILARLVMGAARKAAHRGYLSTRKKLNERFDDVAQQIYRREQIRRVTCDQVADWQACTIAVTRRDTGEVVEARKMSPAERARDMEIVALKP